MDGRPNESIVGDVAKLMAHRLIARRLLRDPSMLARAKTVQTGQSERFAGWSFSAEWDALLALPAAELSIRLVARDADMTRLRLSSPFYLAVDALKDPTFRTRLGQAARRVAMRRAAMPVTA